MTFKSFFYCVLLILIAVNANAQYNKGKTLIGIASGLGLNGGQTSFSTSSNTTKSDDFETDPTKSLSINFAPRAGYFIANQLVAGLEFNYSYLELSDRGFGVGDLKVNQLSAGPFIRYYFKGNRINPFLEGGLSFGTNKNTIEGSNPVNGGDLEIESNLFSYAGGAGMAISLGNRVSFDAVLVYLRSQFKPKENNEDNSRTISNSFGLRLGFSIYIGQ